MQSHSKTAMQAHLLKCITRTCARAHTTPVAAPCIIFCTLPHSHAVGCMTTGIFGICCQGRAICFMLLGRITRCRNLVIAFANAAASSSHSTATHHPLPPCRRPPPRHLLHLLHLFFRNRQLLLPPHPLADDQWCRCSNHGCSHVTGGGAAE